MIFFGTKANVLQGEPVMGVQCPSCGNSQFNSFGVLRYFHLYWIPTFPTSRKVGLECTNCKHALMDDDVPSHMTGEIRSSVFTMARVLPRFTGLFIIGILAVFIVNAINADTAEEIAYLSQPAVDDLYTTNYTKIFVEGDEEYPYGLMRITAIDGTNVEMQMGGMVYNKGSGITDDIDAGKADLDTYYEAEFVMFEIDELKQYYDEGAFYSIDRP